MTKKLAITLFAVNFFFCGMSHALTTRNFGGQVEVTPKGLYLMNWLPHVFVIPEFELLTAVAVVTKSKGVILKKQNLDTDQILENPDQSEMSALDRRRAGIENRTRKEAGLSDDDVYADVIYVEDTLAGIQRTLVLTEGKINVFPGLITLDSSAHIKNGQLEIQKSHLPSEGWWPVSERSGPQFINSLEPGFSEPSPEDENTNGTPLRLVHSQSQSDLDRQIEKLKSELGDSATQKELDTKAKELERLEARKCERAVLK